MYPLPNQLTLLWLQQTQQRYQPHKVVNKDVENTIQWLICMFLRIFLGNTTAVKHGMLQRKEKRRRKIQATEKQHKTSMTEPDREEDEINTG